MKREEEKIEMPMENNSASMVDLLRKYLEMFHENFPVFLIKGKTNEEIENAIADCIKNNKKSDLYLDKEANC